MTAQTDPTRPRPHWREVKLHRVALLFVLIVGALGALGFGAVSLAPRFISLHWLHAMDKSNRTLDRLPTPIADTQDAALSGAHIERFGCSFQLPWETAEYERDLESLVLMRFHGNTGMMFKNPDQAPKSYADIAKEGSSQRAELAQLLGEDPIRSNYNLTLTALRERPGDTHWWSSRHQIARSLMLLNVKDVLFTGYQSAHPVAADSVRGFQFDRPNGKDFQLLLFDNKDRHYEIDLFGNGTLTQPQINAIVASFQPRP